MTKKLLNVRYLFLRKRTVRQILSTPLCIRYITECPFVIISHSTWRAGAKITDGPDTGASPGIGEGIIYPIYRVLCTIVLRSRVPSLLGPIFPSEWYSPTPTVEWTRILHNQFLPPLLSHRLPPTHCSFCGDTAASSQTQHRLLTWFVIVTSKSNMCSPKEWTNSKQ